MPSFINLYILLFLLLVVMFPHSLTKTGSQSLQWATLMVYSNLLLAIDIFCHQENSIIRFYLYPLQILRQQCSTSRCNISRYYILRYYMYQETELYIGLYSCAFHEMLTYRQAFIYLPFVVSVVTELTQGHQVEGLLDCFHGNHTC